MFFDTAITKQMRGLANGVAITKDRDWNEGKALVGEYELCHFCNSELMDNSIDKRKPPINCPLP
jgi:hypothetical protein